MNHLTFKICICLQIVKTKFDVSYSNSLIYYPNYLPIKIEIILLNYPSAAAKIIIFGMAEIRKENLNISHLQTILTNLV